MYHIINKTTGKTFSHKGDFPLLELEAMLNNDEELIVISFYSNTIKIPYSTEFNGEVQWEFTDFKIPQELLTIQK